MTSATAAGTGGEPEHMLVVEELAKHYLDGRASAVGVQGVSFRVPAGAFYTLLGPSGCGKTTTLRCVAGLERPDSGRVYIGDRLVSDPARRQVVPPRDRNIGMVFQNYGVWPHLSVFENVAFPLRVARGKLPRRVIRERVEEALAVVRLAGLEGRSATALSGGQQQRLSFARALISRPRLLLLDEPLASLDAKLRETMRGEIRALQQRLGVTTLFVTHDQTEALAMSDRVAVLSEGRVIQEGTPQEIYDHPVDLFVAGFVGQSNAFPAVVREPRDRTSTRLDLGIGELYVSPPAPDVRSGESVTVFIRPKHIRLCAGQEGPQLNRFTGVVTSATFLGDAVEVAVAVGEQTIVLRHDGTSAVRPGDQVRLELPSEKCMVLKRDAGQAGEASPRG